MQPWSEGLRLLAVWLSGLLTFEQAESVLDQVGQVSLSDMTTWRQVQKSGAQAQALQVTQHATATAVPDRQQMVPGEAPSTDRLAAAMDGAMLHLRGEGWKELKVGGIGHIELQPRRDKTTGDQLELVHPGVNEPGVRL